MVVKCGTVPFIIVLLTSTTGYFAIDQLVVSNVCNYCTSEQCTPTVHPAKNFNPRSDAQKLRKAMRSWRNNEDTLIQVLTDRSDLQRLQIDQEYVGSGSTLVHDLSGKSLAELAALATPLPVFYAEELSHAIKTKDYDTLIEVLTSLPGCAIREIALIYRMINRVPLYMDISKHTWFKFRKVMMELARGIREDPGEPDLKRARKDAQSLISAGVKSQRISSSKFREILTKRSFPQLKHTIDAYDTIRLDQDKSYVSIIKDIETFFTKNVNATYSAIVQNVLDPPGFFAQSLNSALNGLIMAKYRRQAIRIIRGRCEVDLGNIKNRYQELFNKPLSDDVREAAFKHFKKCLVAIIDENSRQVGFKYV